MRKLRIAMSCLTIVSGGSAASAQELVANGHFHTDLGGWTHAGGGTQAWSALDWEANPGSGSARVTNDFAVANINTGSVSCIALAAPGTYEVGGHIRIPSGQGLGGSAFVRVSWFPNAFCDNPATASATGELVFTTTTDTWVPTLNAAVAIPAGMQSVRVSMNVTKLPANGSLAVNFDRVRFGPAGTTPVELQGFRVE